ncbi:MAG: hypothetical protein GY856_09625, partial [bacterium]|nr:hypothetical protein [bacterium]
MPCKFSFDGDRQPGHLERQTVFLVYSENGLSDEAAVLLAETGVLILDPGKTAGFEASGI